MNSRNYYEDRMEKEDREPTSKNVNLIVDLYRLLTPLDKVQVRKLLMQENIF